MVRDMDGGGPVVQNPGSAPPAPVSVSGPVSGRGVQLNPGGSGSSASAGASGREPVPIAVAVSVPVTVEPRVEDSRPDSALSVSRLGVIDLGASVALANQHVNPISLDLPSLQLAIPFERPAAVTAAAEAARSGGPAWYLTAAGTHLGVEAAPWGSAGSPGPADTPADPRAAAEPRVPLKETAVPIAPAPDAAPPSADAAPAQAGLIPLDVQAWERGVQQFFQHLGVLGQEADDEPPWPRWAPWFVVVGTLLLGLELARRFSRVGAAPEPAEPLRRGLAWRWSDEFSTSPPADRS
jgi:hypothetical protein